MQTMYWLAPTKISLFQTKPGAENAYNIPISFGVQMGYCVENINMTQTFKARYKGKQKETTRIAVRNFGWTIKLIDYVMT